MHIWAAHWVIIKIKIKNKKKNELKFGQCAGNKIICMVCLDAGGSGRSQRMSAELAEAVLGNLGNYILMKGSMFSVLLENRKRKLIFYY